jgi:hypothetical protein
VSDNFISSLPESCEVNSPDSQDVLLAADYLGLPNLRQVFQTSRYLILFSHEFRRVGSFRSWSNSVGDGFVMFSGWAEQLPTLNLE